MSKSAISAAAIEPVPLPRDIGAVVDPLEKRRVAIRVWSNHRIGPVGRLPRMVALLASALMISSSAVAQIEPLRIPDPGAGITLLADAAYDSNIFRTSENLADPVDDIIVTPRVIAEYRQAFGQNDIRVKLDGAYSYYTNYNDRSRLRAEADLAGTIRIAGQCQVLPSARLLRQRADYGDVNRAIDNQQTFTTLGLEANCPRPAGFYPHGAYLRDTTDNDNEFAFADQKSESYTGGIGYARPSLGKLLAYYAYTSSNRQSLGITTRIHRAGGIFERAVVSRFAVKADVHYLDARSRGAQIPGYRGLGWDAVVTVRPVPRTKVELTSGRRIVNDSLVPSGFAVQTLYGANGEWQVLPSLQIRLAAERGRRNFRRDPEVIFSPIGSDKYTNLLAGVRRNVGARVGINADVRRITRRTDSGFNAFDLTLVSVGASLKLQ